MTRCATVFGTLAVLLLAGQGDESAGGPVTLDWFISIVDPDAVIAEGFSPDVMPSDYGRRLSNRDLEALVEYPACASAAASPSAR